MNRNSYSHWARIRHLFLTAVSLTALPATSTAADVVEKNDLLKIVTIGAFIIIALVVALLLVQRNKLKLARAMAGEMSTLADQQVALIANLRTTRELSMIGEWSWRRADDSMTFDGVAAHLHGLSLLHTEPLEEMALSTWRSFIHPDDVEQLDHFLHCVYAGLKTQDIRYRVRLPDDTERTLEASGATLETNAQGQPTRVHGLVRDVTESAALETSLQTQITELKAKVADLGEAQDLADKVIALADIGVIRWNGGQGGVRVSKRACQIFGLPATAEQTMEDPSWWLEHVHPDDRDAIKRKAAEVFSGSAPELEEYRLQLPTGESRWVRSVSSFRRDLRGRPVEGVGIILEIPAPAVIPGKEA